MDPFSSQSLWTIAIFIVGYLCIIFEHQIGVNKATSALLMAVGCWAVQFIESSSRAVNMGHLSDHLANVSQVIIFLLGALTIVETIHIHGGLNLIARMIRIHSKRMALLVIGVITFFLSAVLDNLTTTIVMVALLKKLIEDREDRLLFGATVVIAANAGGAWTPIGDVTTTMLWVGGQVSMWPLITTLFFPSLACLVVSLAWLASSLRGRLVIGDTRAYLLEPRGTSVFALGIAALISVPIFKAVTGLPPFMGILFAMSVMWLVTDWLHRHHRDRDHLRLSAVFARLDLAGIFFFLGILLSVDALETAGLLKALAVWFDKTVACKSAIAALVGVASAIVDNVPLVQACMGMYDLAVIPMNADFWLLIAYCAGTGGSMLIIGSAAGVAFMGLEEVDFFWFLKRATLPATLGYLAGIGVYMLVSSF